MTRHRGASAPPVQAGAAAPRGYAFDNDSVHAEEHHRCLSASLDPVTLDRLRATGVGPGWQCLEVGAGNGSVARWLAGRTAPGGGVLATDVKPHHIPQVPGLRALRHDIVRDALPEAAFDLIHARLVLQHLPERHQVLARLVRALRPGGWLQVDEFDVGYGPVLLAPSPRARELYERFLDAKARVFTSRGGDPTFGRGCAEAMREAGLTGIDPVPHIVPWDAQAPGLRLLVHHTRHLRDALVEAGLTDAELAELREVLRHPEFRAASCVIYSVQARRPPTPGAGR